MFVQEWMCNNCGIKKILRTNEHPNKCADCKPCSANKEGFHAWHPVGVPYQRLPCHIVSTLKSNGESNEQKIKKIVVEAITALQGINGAS